MLQWAAEKVLAPAARAALQAVGYGPDDRIEGRALTKAAAEVAAQLLERAGHPITDEAIEHLRRSLLEVLGRTDEVSLQQVDPLRVARTQLIGSFQRALSSLDDVEVGLRGYGIDADAQQVAVMFVDILTEGLQLWGAKSPQLKAVAERLQSEKVQELLPAMPAGSPPAPEVRAWITVESTPPQAFVFNDGRSPIFDVVPTPMLSFSEWDGTAAATVGGGPLTQFAATQISPGEGYCWPLDHMASWGGQPRVRSHLTVRFTDNAGRSWHLAHDQPTQLS